MNLQAIDDSFFSLVQELKSNNLITVESYKYPSPAHEKDKKKLAGSDLPGSIKELLSSLNGFYLRWNSKNESTDCIGRLKILSASEIFLERKGVVYFDESDPALKHFYPVDFFADESCCGIFYGSKDTSLYYYQFSSSQEPQRLGIDIFKYIEIGMMAKCYSYWPLILLLYQQDGDHEMVNRFKTDMQILFKEFNFENWIKNYLSLKK